MRRRAALAAGGRQLYSAPLAAYAQGSQVGPPTGTSLTTTSSLPGEDSTATFSRIDPIAGSAVSLSGVKKWSNRLFTSTVFGTIPDGEVWWFDACQFSPTSNSFFCIDLDTSNGDNNRLSPTLILTRSTLGPGAGVSADKAMATQRTWVENCDVNQAISGQGRCEDAWIGAAYSTVIGSNFRAGLGLNLTDPHSDGVQITDTGGSAFYRCWLDGGSMTGTLTGNAAMRVGTEFGGTANVDVFYCGFGGRSGNNVQFRGDGGPTGSPITNVRFRGNRYCNNGSAFLHDFQQEGGQPSMLAEWTDNRIGINATIGGISYAAGDLISAPAA